ncbi:MAG: hypothetical protein WCA38_07620 [Candidatus Acidiferrales bacterium]
MVPPFDIFKVLDGEPVWVEAIATLEDAKTRVRELMLSDTREYLILSQVTGNKISVKPGTASP